MGKISFTESQRAAIENRGGALLVAAAAGSGKTKVLVERLLSRVTDRQNPKDIDKFLVITYTKAAAAELRSRILDEINELLAEEPENRALARQSALVYKAPISTIHSFCSSLLRENAQLLGISPEFRVMEDEESGTVKHRVLSGVLDDWYERMEEDFMQLVDTMAAGRDDQKLPLLVLDLYTKLKSHPNPEKWAAGRLAELENCGGCRDAAETSWGRSILDYAKSCAGYWLETFSRAERMVYEDEIIARAYGESFSGTRASLESFNKALEGGWDKARAALPIEFPRLKPLRGYSGPEVDEVKRVRELCKKAMEKLAEIFDCSSAELMEDMAAVLPPVRALFSLTLDFDRAYSEEKARLRALDFSDLEHLAIKLLTDESFAPSEKGVEISERFEEIMVDEYQDANEIQDILFSALSRGGRNLFMVGDVKQSIYRFRLADPTIFLRKYAAFKDLKGAKEGEPRKVVLRENFRSRQNVLDAVNFVFENIMSKSFGEMDYTEREKLNYGKKDYPESEVMAFELDLIEVTSGDEEADYDKTEIEAALVARRIRELVDGGLLISGEEGQRGVSYGDIAILLRSVKNKAEVYAKALRELNIPYESDKASEFWSKSEVIVMVSLLSVVDNPRQDVPLISVLRSPLFGFTPDELVMIRTADRESDFYAALTKAAGTSEKCARFLEFLGELRLTASEMPSDEFLWHVYTRTKALAIFGAMSGGAERKTNLMVLLDLARQFESAGYKGLFDFLNQLKSLMERGGEPPVSNGQAAVNAVRITSIHKSKGLEYPVVILADTSKRFNMDDTKKQLLIHPDLGVGPKRLDLRRGIEYTTLPRMAIARKMRDELLAEELRLLYVAMTRAREKLIVTCAAKNTEKLIERLRPAATAPIAPQFLSECSSMAEWLLLCALLRKESSALPGAETARLPELADSPWDIRYISPETYEKAQAGAGTEASEAPAEADEAMVEEIERRLGFSYPYELATRLPSKLTATELKGRFLDREAAEEAEQLEKPEKRYVFRRPNFEVMETPLTAIERGIALHLVMQYIDYKKCSSLSDIEAEIERLTRDRFITEKQAKVVPPAKILNFFTSPLGREVLDADNLRREFKFSLLVPASDYFPGVKGDEKILLQGVVDCCFEKQGELTVIDFKTDYVTKDSQNERAESYRPQIEAYSKAMERIMGLPVTRKILYFFNTDSAVEL
jgi:ATP-dependent helicase/nuclease subunit A